MTKMHRTRVNLNNITCLWLDYIHNTIRLLLINEIISTRGTVSNSSPIVSTLKPESQMLMYSAR